MAVRQQSHFATIKYEFLYFILRPIKKHKPPFSFYLQTESERAFNRKQALS